MFKRYVEDVLNMNNKWRVWRHCTCVRLLYWLIDYISVIRREFRSTFGPYWFCANSSSGLFVQFTLSKCVNLAS